MWPHGRIRPSACAHGGRRQSRSRLPLVSSSDYLWQVLKLRGGEGMLPVAEWSSRQAARPWEPDCGFPASCLLPPITSAKVPAALYNFLKKISQLSASRPVAPAYLLSLSVKLSQGRSVKNLKNLKNLGRWYSSLLLFHLLSPPQPASRVALSAAYPLAGRLAVVRSLSTAIVIHRLLTSLRVQLWITRGLSRW